MKISKTLELNGEGVQFEGELSEAELDMVIGIGLNYLLQKGLLPFKSVNPEDMASHVDYTETQQ